MRAAALSVLAAIAGALAAEAALAQTAQPQSAYRDKRWEFTLQMRGVEGKNYAFEGGSTAQTKDALGFGLGVSYNVNPHLNIGGEFLWAQQDYNATVQAAPGNPSGSYVGRGSVDLASFMLNSRSGRKGNRVSPDRSGQFRIDCRRCIGGACGIRDLATLAADRTPSRGCALSWLEAGMVSTTTDEWERSLREWTRGFEDGEALGEARSAAEGRMGVGYCNLSLGRMEAAAEALDDAIARAAPVDAFIQALAMSMKGMLLFATGQREAGVALLQDARRIQERIGDHEGAGVAHSFLAQMTFAQGDPGRASTLYGEALAMLEAVAVSVKAWNAYVDDKPLGVLTYRRLGSTAEDFPRVRNFEEWTPE